ncbi:MAG TPA: NAD(P)-binding domain-containing protein [Gemmatimonadales bacterium]|nr:NAD(P)-binding domain-containing protein [Gemmatimonadales bacterium]
MKKIGILGSAVVGQTLAQGFQQHGYEVRIGSRTPAKLADFTRSSGIAAGTFDEVGTWGELLVLAVHGTAALEAMTLAGAGNHRGKVVIDTTNPLAKEPPVDGVLKVFTGPNESLLERLQVAFPETRLVKAFNSVGTPTMVNPKYAGGQPTMFFCGNDAEAKAEVAEILRKFGWEPWDMGTAVAARAIEPLCQLWCIPGFRENHWTHAFKLLWD